MRPVLAVLVLLLPGLAGCFSDDATPTAPASTAASSQEEAGARAGEAPVAPRDAFQVSASEPGAAPDAPPVTVTAYPLPFQTNPAKAPVVREFEGEYEAQQCAPTGELPLGGLGLAEASRFFDLGEDVRPGDAFSYDIRLAFENADDAWAEIHLWYGLGAASGMWEEPTGDKRGEVVLNFTGQGYRATEDQPAAVGVMCWYGSTTRAIPFKLTVALTFVEGAVPAQTPALFEAPANATRLLVTGLPVDPSKGVLSHFRVFGPDDSLVCECALSSNQQAASVELEGPGGYVVLVDHTDNGFVSFALDAPSPSGLRGLGSEWVLYPLVGSDGGPLEATATVELPSTPLNLGTWVFPTTADEHDVGMGRGYHVTVANDRGEVTRQAMAGWVTYRVVAPGVLWTNDWYPLAIPGDWEFFTDHHAFGAGPHEVALHADDFRGEAVMFAMHYVR